MWKKKLVVASIDFGTTYSGFALSLLKQYEENPLTVYTQLWKSGDQPPTYKTPTCLLLTPEGKFHSFGYEAEKKYARLAEDDEHKPWRYFRRFKMELYKDKDKGPDKLFKVGTIKDTEGRGLPAVDVFGMAIKYLKDEIRKIVCDRSPGIREDDIYYVLTTPAIWSERAKSFMRAAAEKAGIKPEHLKIALEPECAAVYVRKQNRADVSTMTAGNAFMVIDLGGGTCDITVHRLTQNNTLDELAIPGGGPWGSDRINRMFEDFLESVIGTEAFENFKIENREDYLELQRQIEHKKCEFKCREDESEYVTMRLPQSFRDTHRHHHNMDLSDTIKNKEDFKQLLKVKSDKLRIDKNKIKEMFDGLIAEIIEKVQSILSNNTFGPEIHTLILAGGFADCELVKMAFKSRFCTKTVIVPDEAVTVIIKGAVIYGRDVSVINSRICRYTYGLDWNEDFDATIHPESKKEETDDGPVCKDIFHVLAKEGSRITKGAIEPIEAYVKYSYQTEMAFPFYRSKAPNSPKFIDDFGCEHIGTLTVDLEDVGSGLDRSIKLHVELNDAEITAKAVDDELGREFRVRFCVDEA